MPLLFALMVIVVPPQFETPEQALHLDRAPCFPYLPRVGLICLIDLIGGGLEQVTHHGSGRFEDRCSNE